MSAIHSSLSHSTRPFPPASLCLASLFFIAWAWPVSAQSARVVLAPAAGFTITWDGNDGGFSSPEAGVGPSNNVALASNGAVAIGSSQLDLGVHFIANVNDGRYGNTYSWISAGGLNPALDPNPWVGVAFPDTVSVSSVAWSRDNGDTTEGACGGTCMDRAVGTYTLQYTQVPMPDATTPETGDAAVGWAAIGTVQYTPGTDSALFSAYLRHRFDVATGGNPIEATGLRIKVSTPDMAIDEIEVNPLPDPVPPITTFIEIASAPDYAISWDRNEANFSTDASPAPAPANDALSAGGATAFGSSQLDFGVHFIVNVNDGLYGNSHSWIPDFAANPDPAPFIGINFGRQVLLRNLAWSRDNGDTVETGCPGGTCVDRALGLYVIQITTMADPGLATPDACGPTPESGWVTIGTVRYKADDLKYFNSYLRHRFDLAQGGQPIPATGLRIWVPNNQIAIDEIEVNVNQAVEQEIVRITNAPGLTISWDGNDGDFQNPAAGAAAPDNRALTTYGTVAFGSSQLDFGVHFIANVNDGLYGNSHSWIPDFVAVPDPAPFIGLNFNGTVAITNIAWSRDNGDTTEGPCTGGTCTDRALGVWVLQYTTVEAPDASTAETGDPATGWADIGTVDYTAGLAGYYTPHLRHRLELSEAGGPISATGIRIKAPNNGSCIDEIEINTPVTPPPLPSPVGIAPAAGYAISWDGNNGHFYNPAALAFAPANAALASEGTTPFGTSQLDAYGHLIANLNDGLYGNAHSWISAGGVDGVTDPNPYIGLNFGRTVMIENIAWSRDNGDITEPGCTGGTCVDRTLGVYTLQVTAAENPGLDTPETDDPATGWATIGTIEYRGESFPDFTSYLRHRFEVSADGGPIEATGLRFKVPSNQTCIDEIEVNTAAVRPLPELSTQQVGNTLVITWTGGGGLESADQITGPWTCLQSARTGYTVDLSSAPARFYRVRR